MQQLERGFSRNKADNGGFFRSKSAIIRQNLRESAFRQIFLIAAITLLGGWLRFHAIGVKSIWLDEAFSIWIAAHPLGELIDWLVRIDQHPPLYYLLLALWQRLFGDLQGPMRALSALLSTLTIPVIYAIGKRLTRDNITALLAALLLAVAPFHVRFAQETRMYALLTLVAALAIYCAVALLQTEDDRPFKISDWWTLKLWRTHPALRFALGLAVAQAAVMLTHNTATIFFPLALNLPALGALLYRRQTGRRVSMPRVNQSGFFNDWLQTQTATLLLWSPWAIAFVRQALAVDQEFWIPPPDLTRIWASITELSLAHMPGWMPSTPWVLLGLALAIFGLWRLRHAGAWAALLLSLWLTPVIGELLVSSRRPIFYDRTLIWTTLAFLVLVAIGIRTVGTPRRANSAASRLPGWARGVQVALVLLLVTISGIALHNYYNFFTKEGWDQAAAYVAAEADDDDLILFNATWVQLPFDYYFRHYDRPNERHGAPSDLFASGQLEPKMTADDLPGLHKLIADEASVWLVYSHDWYTDPDQLIPAELERQLQPTDAQSFSGLRILRYDRTD